MMIKLTPEHIGTRVLLSDGTVHFVTDMTDKSPLIVGVCGSTRTGSYNKIVLDDDDDPLIQCLLDAPNPLDVPVPEWCEDVVVWYHDEAIQVLDLEQFKDWRRDWSKYPPDLRNLIKWSPAPGQMPPKTNEEIN